MVIQSVMMDSSTHFGALATDAAPRAAPVRWINQRRAAVTAERVPVSERNLEYP
jgi:hypothetical protein